MYMINVSKSAFLPQRGFQKICQEGWKYIGVLGRSQAGMDLEGVAPPRICPK